jgi:AAA family ATP:ADP antiporter
MTRLLQRFVNIDRDEVTPILLAAFFFFCILTALMLLRPVRESLGMQSGLDSVRVLFYGTAIVTLLVNPAFAYMVSRFPRLTFITATYGVFALSLLGFWAVLVMAPDAIGDVSGRIFYVWYSVFNLFVTMVFWGLMADRFTLAQSKRLFGVIAVGGTVGAITGPTIAAWLAEPLGTPALLLISIGFLIVGVITAWILARYQPDHEKDAAVQPLRPASAAARGEATTPAGTTAAPPKNEAVVIGGNAWAGIRSVFRSKYLIGISVYVLILAVVSTFIYFTRLAMVADLGVDRDEMTAVFAQIDMKVQIATLVLQLLVAGNLMKRIGVPITLALLPLTVALGFIGLAISATLTMLVAVDAAFRAVQRAIMRPARETLFTVVSREDKYKSKAFTDTFVYRAGDVLGSKTEEILTGLGSGLLALVAFSVPMALLWGVLGYWLGMTQRKIAKEQGVPEEEPKAA